MSEIGQTTERDAPRPRADGYVAARREASTSPAPVLSVSSVTPASDAPSRLGPPRITPPPAEPVARRRDASVTLGARVYAASAVALGLVGLVSGDFAAV